MTHRVGAKGQIVIPKEMRDVLGINPGDEVTFWLDGDHVAVRPEGLRTPLKGRFPDTNLADALLEDRAIDREREDEH